MGKLEFVKGVGTCWTPDEVRCESCGAGPFLLVMAREFPRLCGDCSDSASRDAHGWTPENSLD